MTALEMKADICRRIVEECQKQMKLRDSHQRGTEERIKQQLILEGMLKAVSIATD